MPSKTLSSAITVTTKFNGYKINVYGAEEAKKAKGITSDPVLTGLTKRHSNLLLDVVFGEGSTVQPGAGLFKYNNYEESRGKLSGLTNVISLQARDEAKSISLSAGSIKKVIGDFSEKAVFGNESYNIAPDEVREIVNSACVYTSPQLPPKFYYEFKKLLDSYGIRILPTPIKAPSISDLFKRKPEFKELFDQASTNPTAYGFSNVEEINKLKHLNLYQLGAMVVKTEKLKVLVDDKYKLKARKVGEDDSINLISACGIRPDGWDFKYDKTSKEIIKNMFKTVLIAANSQSSPTNPGLVLLPAIGSGVWAGSDDVAGKMAGTFYWGAFFEALEELETSRGLPNISNIAVNANGKSPRVAEVFAQKLSENAINGLCRKVVNISRDQTDILLLADNYKKANPSHQVFLVNASDPDVTLGQHVGQYVNNLVHASTTEENYAACTTSLLCDEQITQIMQYPERIFGVGKESEVRSLLEAQAQLKFAAIKREQEKTYKEVFQKDLKDKITGADHVGFDWWMFPSHSNNQDKQEYSINHKTTLGKAVYKKLATDKKYLTSYRDSIEIYFSACGWDVKKGELRPGVSTLKQPHEIRFDKLVESFLGMTLDNQRRLECFKTQDEQNDFFRNIKKFADRTNQHGSNGNYKAYHKTLGEIAATLTQKIGTRGAEAPPPVKIVQASTLESSKDILDYVINNIKKVTDPKERERAIKTKVQYGNSELDLLTYAICSNLKNLTADALIDLMGNMINNGADCNARNDDHATFLHHLVRRYKDAVKTGNQASVDKVFKVMDAFVTKHKPALFNDSNNRTPFDNALADQKLLKLKDKLYVRNYSVSPTKRTDAVISDYEKKLGITDSNDTAFLSDHTVVKFSATTTDARKAKIFSWNMMNQCRDDGKKGYSNNPANFHEKSKQYRVRLDREVDYIESLLENNWPDFFNLQEAQGLFEITARGHKKLDKNFVTRMKAKGYEVVAPTEGKNLLTIYRNNYDRGEIHQDLYDNYGHSTTSVITFIDKAGKSIAIGNMHLDFEAKEFPELKRIQQHFNEKNLPCILTGDTNHTVQEMKGVVPGSVGDEGHATCFDCVAAGLDGKNDYTKYTSTDTRTGKAKSYDLAIGNKLATITVESYKKFEADKDGKITQKERTPVAAAALPAPSAKPKSSLIIASSMGASITVVDNEARFVGFPLPAVRGELVKVVAGFLSPNGHIEEAASKENKRGFKVVVSGQDYRLAPLSEVAKTGEKVASEIIEDEVKLWREGIKFYYDLEGVKVSLSEMRKSLPEIEGALKDFKINDITSLTQNDFVEKLLLPMMQIKGGKGRLTDRQINLLNVIAPYILFRFECKQSFKMTKDNGVEVLRSNNQLSQVRPFYYNHLPKLDSENTLEARYFLENKELKAKKRLELKNRFKAAVKLQLCAAADNSEGCFIMEPNAYLHALDIAGRVEGKEMFLEAAIEAIGDFSNNTESANKLGKIFLQTTVNNDQAKKSVTKMTGIELYLTRGMDAAYPHISKGAGKPVAQMVMGAATRPVGNGAFGGGSQNAAEENLLRQMPAFGLVAGPQNNDKLLELGFLKAAARDISSAVAAPASKATTSISSEIKDYISNNANTQANDEVKKLVQGIAAQTNETNPKSAYRGIGAKGELVEEYSLKGSTVKSKGIKLSSVFSHDIERFMLEGYGVGSKTLEGKIITSVTINGADATIAEIFYNNSGDATKALRAIAAAFHAEGMVNFTTSDGSKYSCDNTNNKTAIFAPGKLNEWSALSEMLDKDKDAAEEAIRNAIAAPPPSTSPSSPIATSVKNPKPRAQG